MMKKIILRVAAMLLVLYSLICAYLYFNQESILFRPRVADKSKVYTFSTKHEEYSIDLNGQQMNTVLFKSDSSKGLIFYLHGNVGCIEDWAYVAPFYMNNGYDVYMVDYRGYGKSTGEIRDEKELYNDVSKAYDFIRTKYNEENIIILGYSLGTGIASYIAAKNRPKHLILQAPYYNMTDMMYRRFPFAPSFLLRYKFDTAARIKKCAMPISIFHGDKDQVVPFASSEALVRHLKKGDEFIRLTEQGHHGITNNSVYQNEVERILK